MRTTKSSPCFLCNSASDVVVEADCEPATEDWSPTEWYSHSDFRLVGLFWFGLDWFGLVWFRLAVIGWFKVPIDDEHKVDPEEEIEEAEVGCFLISTVLFLSISALVLVLAFRLKLRSRG